MKLPAHELAEVTQALLDQKMIFLYTNDYVLKHDSIRNIDDFAFTAYDDFVSFLKKRILTTTNRQSRKSRPSAKCNENAELKSLIGADLKP